MKIILVAYASALNDARDGCPVRTLASERWAPDSEARDYILEEGENKAASLREMSSLQKASNQFPGVLASLPILSSDLAARLEIFSVLITGSSRAAPVLMFRSDCSLRPTLVG